MIKKRSVHIALLGFLLAVPQVTHTFIPLPLPIAGFLSALGILPVGFTASALAGALGMWWWKRDEVTKKINETHAMCEQMLGHCQKFPNICVQLDTWQEEQDRKNMATMQWMDRRFQEMQESQRLTVDVLKSHQDALSANADVMHAYDNMVHRLEAENKKLQQELARQEDAQRKKKQEAETAEIRLLAIEQCLTNVVRQLQAQGDQQPKKRKKRAAKALSVVARGVSESSNNIGPNSRLAQSTAIHQILMPMFLATGNPDSLASLPKTMSCYEEDRNGQLRAIPGYWPRIDDVMSVAPLSMRSGGNFLLRGWWTSSPARQAFNRAIRVLPK